MGGLSGYLRAALLVHKIANVLAALPKSVPPEAKRHWRNRERRGPPAHPGRGDGLRRHLWGDVSQCGREDHLVAVGAVIAGSGSLP